MICRNIGKYIYSCFITSNLSYRLKACVCVSPLYSCLRDKLELVSVYVCMVLHICVWECVCWSSQGLPSCVSKHWYSPHLRHKKKKITPTRTSSPFYLSQTTIIDASHWTQHVLHPLSDTHVGGSVARWGPEPFVNSQTVNGRQGVEPNEEACVRPHWSISTTHTHTPHSLTG